jgi:hypothetical protein
MDPFERMSLGDLHDVIPVLQTVEKGDYAVSLVSLERWDGALVGTFITHYPDLTTWDSSMSSGLRVSVFVDGERVWPEVPGSQSIHSDGGIASHRHERTVPFNGVGHDLIIQTELLIHTFDLNRPGPDGGRSIVANSRTVESKGHYGFTVSLPERQIEIPPAEPVKKPPISRQHPRNCPPDTGSPHRVIPIRQTQSAGDWLVTLIALEISPTGMVLTSRVRGGGTDIPDLGVAICDDLGNGYAMWPSAGGGTMEYQGKRQWRWWTIIEPAIDPQAHVLFINVQPTERRGEGRVVPAPVAGEPMMTFVVAVGW